MRKHLSIALLALTALTMAGKSIVVDGIRYTLNGTGTNATVSIKVADKKALPAHVVVPPQILIDGREYPVTTVEKEAFINCKEMQSVVIPPTVTQYGQFAFLNCSGLKTAILSDEAKADINKGNYGYGGGGIFKGCTSLEDVRGTNVPYPKYVVYETIWKCDEVPFFQTVEHTGAVTMARMQGSQSFVDYAMARVKEPIEQWQKRKDYETLAQWEERVNDVNRRKMINEYTTEARNTFIKENTPPALFGNIESYNEEFGFFIINTANMGTLYASVPQADRTNFEENWSKVQIMPVYGILDGELAVLDCTFKLGNKEYSSAQKYDEDDFTAMAINITPLAALREYEQMIAQSSKEGTTVKKTMAAPDEIDINIPSAENTNSSTFAVIIGNEDYRRVAPVDYAMNDARIFAKYCNRALGIPESNIRTYYNSTYGDIVAAMEDIDNIASAYNGDLNVIFYYAGHGVPDESNRNAFLLPIDATGTQTEVCYPLDKLYSQLGDLNARSVVAFIDACFSGSLRGDGMLASARGIKLRPRDVAATGNLVVLSAASADQSAFPFHDKNHGLFTYYLLKKLNDSKGDASMGELADYVVEEVSKQAIVENKKPQKPNVKWSTSLNDSWREIKLK